MSGGRNGGIFPETATEKFIRQVREQEAVLRSTIEPFRTPQDPSGLSGFKEFHRQSLAMADAARQVQPLREHIEGLQRSMISYDMIIGAVQSALAYHQSFEELKGSLGIVAEALRARQHLVRPIEEWLSQNQINQLRDAAVFLRASSSLVAEVGTVSVVTGHETLSLGEAAEHLEEAVPALERGEPVTNLIGLLIKFIERLGANTIVEIEKLGLFSILLALLALEPLWEQPDFKDGDHDTINETRQSVDEAKRLLEQMLENQEKTEYLYLQQFPRAIAMRSARVRTAPSRSAPVQARLHEGDTVQLIRKYGRWREIAYRDSLTQILVTGWIYGSLLQDAGTPASAR